MPPFLKNFLNWFTIKPKLDGQNHKPPFIEEGNLWWCRLGENIGTEISGKGREFARPVIIHTKFSEYRYLVIPTTTKFLYKNGRAKEGERFIKFSHHTKNMLACLDQIRVIDYRRIKNKIGSLDEMDFHNICNAFDVLFSKDTKK